MAHTFKWICRCQMKFVRRIDLQVHVREIHNNNQRAKVLKSLGPKGKRLPTPRDKRRFDLD